MNGSTALGSTGAALADPSGEQPLSTVLAFWAAALRYDDLPAGTVTSAKRLLLDTLAVAWAGSSATGNQPIDHLVRTQGGQAESHTWVDGHALPATAACFINALHASALDFDSVHERATVHPDIVVLPALLALAGRRTLSGRDFIAAHAVGDELLVRFGLSVTHHPGWFYTSVFGVFAAAAACAKALGGSPDTVRQAMGVALSRAAGSQQALLEGSLTKRMQTAFAARDGLESALFAVSGVTSPMQVFEGQAGVGSLYVELDRASMLGGLGHTWHLQALTLKSFPSCFCNHAAIQAVITLQQQHALEVADIEDIAVTLTPFSARLVGGAFAPQQDSASPQVAAQFSVQYSVANAFLRGGLAVANITPDAVLQPDVLALAARVRVRIDPQQSHKFAPALLQVQRRDGRWLEQTTHLIPGTPALPLSESQLRAKVLQCFASGTHPLSPQAAHALVDRVDTLETLSDMRELLAPLYR